MKTFLKCFGLAIAIQVFLIVVAGTVDSVLGLGDAVLGRFLLLYLPFISLIERWGHYHGNAALIEPFWRGVPLGILVYSLLAGVLGLTIRRHRQVKNAKPLFSQK
jgi:hypothetical protein